MQVGQGHGMATQVGRHKWRRGLSKADRGSRAASDLRQPTEPFVASRGEGPIERGRFGAGPGNPGLVTFRAKELIASAAVVVYDCPVHRDLLGWCRPDCEKIDVGQRPSSPARPPEEIEALLVARAKAGRSVVRLQSGEDAMAQLPRRDALFQPGDAVQFCWSAADEVTFP